jgi:hypothetical protein
MEYKNKNTEKQKCPKCNSTANVVKMIVGFRYSFCGIKFDSKEKRGQKKLFL